MADGLQLVEALKQGVKHYKTLASEQATRIDALEKELQNQRTTGSGADARDQDQDQDHGKGHDLSPMREAEMRAEVSRLRTQHAEAEARWESEKLELLKQRDVILEFVRRHKLSSI